jgi:anti-sigma B factor antagonist
MSVTYETVEGVGVVKAQGTLMVTDAEAFRQSFDQWFRGATCRKVVVDMGQLEQLDSAGLGALVAVTQQVRERGGDLTFAALQKRPRLVFEITRFHRVCEIFDTVEEALRAAR